MTPRQYQEKLKEYSVFDCPEGQWIGRLDITYPIGKALLYCCFTCQQPEESKGKKLRLAVNRSKNYKPSPTSPDMRFEEGGCFRLETHNLEYTLNPEWTHAERISI